MAYMDPSFAKTGKMLPASDLYGMGLTWLSLVTAITDPIGLHAKVEDALDAGELMTVVDREAADWPVEVGVDLQCPQADAGAFCLSLWG